MDLKELMSKVENFGKNDLIYWSNALAGEVGELCNLVKKQYRDGTFLEVEMAEELADVFIYVVLMARDILKIDLEAEILNKLNKIRKRRTA